MGKLKINPTGAEEILEFYLDPVQHPVAFHNKVDELVEMGMTKEEAEISVKNIPVVLEVYYSNGQGVFLVESEAIEFNDIHNPYDGKVVPNPEKEPV